MNTIQRLSRNLSQPNRDQSRVGHTMSRETAGPEFSEHPKIPVDDWLSRVGEMVRLLPPRGWPPAEPRRTGD